MEKIVTIEELAKMLRSMEGEFIIHVEVEEEDEKEHTEESVFT